MMLHLKGWRVSTGRATWEEVFVTTPTHVRRLLQAEASDRRRRWGQIIWRDTGWPWRRARRDLVGIHPSGIAVTDLRCLIEIRRPKGPGGNMLHVEARDQQASLAPERRGHRSETALDSAGDVHT